MFIQLSRLERAKIIKAFVRANEMTHESMSVFYKEFRRDNYPRIFRAALSQALMDFFPEKSCLVQSRTLYAIIHIHEGLDIIINSKKDLDREIWKNEFWEMSDSLPFLDTEMRATVVTNYQAILVYEMEDEELGDTVYLKCLEDVSAPISLCCTEMYDSDAIVSIPDENFDLREDENLNKINFGG